MTLIEDALVFGLLPLPVFCSPLRFEGFSVLTCFSFIRVRSKSSFGGFVFVKGVRCGLPRRRFFCLLKNSFFLFFTACS